MPPPPGADRGFEEPERPLDVPSILEPFAYVGVGAAGVRRKGREQLRQDTDHRIFIARRLGRIQQRIPEYRCPHLLGAGTVDLRAERMQCVHRFPGTTELDQDLRPGQRRLQIRQAGGSTVQQLERTGPATGIHEELHVLQDEFRRVGEVRLELRKEGGGPFTRSRAERAVRPLDSQRGTAGNDLLARRIGIFVALDESVDHPADVQRHHLVR